MIILVVWDKNGGGDNAKAPCWGMKVMVWWFGSLIWFAGNQFDDDEVDVDNDNSMLIVVIMILLFDATSFQGWESA